MSPKIPPPGYPQQLLAQCRWPAAPHRLPAWLAATHQDAGSPARLSLLPPARSALCQLWAWVGEGHFYALVPGRRAQAPEVL